MNSKYFYDYYDGWLAAGSETDQNGSVPHEVKMFYLLRTIDDYGLKCFVESGTSHGDGVASIVDSVDHVYTIEAHPPSYEFSKKRFDSDDRVEIFFGDSAKLLPSILVDLPPSVFWLDAHYSGDGTAMLDKETPIVAELEAIANSQNDEHCIVIDDARGFGVWNDYPTVQWVMDFCDERFPNHECFLEGDEIFIVPRSR